MVDFTELNSEFKKILERVQSNFRKLCTARVNVDLVSDVVVQCYGSASRLMDIANLSVPVSRTILIKPYDSSVVEDIQKALIKQKPEYAPVVDGEVIKITLNPPTEETRKKSVKEAKMIVEQAKISVRNMRKAFIDNVKKEDAPEDTKKKTIANVDQEVKKMNLQLDKEFESKEKELMTI